jgi:hypothetical protein
MVRPSIPAATLGPSLPHLRPQRFRRLPPGGHGSRLTWQAPANAAEKKLRALVRRVVGELA